MEETIGYEALLSAEDWAELDLATDWVEPEDGHHASVWYPRKDGTDRYDVECAVCGHISAEDSSFEAEKLATLHEILRARPVQSRGVEQ